MYREWLPHKEMCSCHELNDLHVIGQNTSDDDIILPDLFHNTHKIEIYRSPMVTMFAVKKLEKSKPLSAPNGVSKFRSTIPKMGRKNYQALRMSPLGFSH
jgi:hypothetical protein